MEVNVFNREFVAQDTPNLDELSVVICEFHFEEELQKFRFSSWVMYAYEMSRLVADCLELFAQRFGLTSNEILF